MAQMMRAAPEITAQQSIPLDANGASSNTLLDRIGRSLGLGIVLLAIILAGLPVAVWLDLRNLSDNALRGQAREMSGMIGSMRDYYATNIVGRVLAHDGKTQVQPNYLSTPGAIPIPATLSLELGQVIGTTNNSSSYRFFSDFPFSTRQPHSFDAFEREALAALRRDPQQRITQASGSIFNRQFRLVTPVLMDAGCVQCHNTHPDSPKRDWKVGDVRGIEEFTVHQPIAANVFAFKYLLGYFALVAAIGLTFISIQRHQSGVIARFNQELARANEFLASVSAKISKYLSPQHYKSIFSGQKDVAIATERKKLTIFFSDVVSFTSTSERLQPEELTAMLNEYLTEMSAIAAKHGGTVNKFIGDAILVFFGDPETKGVAEDARACVRMAFDMQKRLAELDVQWRSRGVEEPFRARMGINTGYCNVGNFGSDDRMDYTIIGAEANLAARLQTLAEPGGMVLSYETFMLVRDMVKARPLEEITLKGISHPVVPYSVEGPAANGEADDVISEQDVGLQLHIDLRALDRTAATRARKRLEQALATLKKRQKQQPA
jgi:class 3 adenylate cyclase